MNNEFVSYEIALKLKELGFDEPCFDNYSSIGELYQMRFSKQSTVDMACLAPLYQQVFRWFREQFNWQSSIEATKDQHNHELGFNYWIWNNVTGEEYNTMPKNRPSGDWCFKIYEEAQKECILDLISIIKNQKK
jgi:hypothetical protein